jgi:large subunit ribosomal protein L6
MSRIGKHPVAVPAGVTVSIDGQRVRAEGKLGTLDRTLMREVVISRDDQGVRVVPRDDSLRSRMMWGTARTLIANLVEGVSNGFTRKMEITGVGYRAQVQGNNLMLQLGYSHDVVYPMPEGIKIVCPDQTHIIVSGSSK